MNGWNTMLRPKGICGEECGSEQPMFATKEGRYKETWGGNMCVHNAEKKRKQPSLGSMSLTLDKKVSISLCELAI